MYIKRLTLRCFRNYRSQEAVFAETTNHLFGANAQGKSNVLEALYLLITGRSFRTQRLSELIQEGESAFEIEADFIEHRMQQTLAIRFDGATKRILHNGSPAPSFATLLGLIRGVLFAPQDHLLVSGPPSMRRRFLDLHLVQLDPLYVHHLARYHRALKHRNALLRAKESTSLEVWEHQMAQAAVYLTMQRLDAISSLQIGASEAKSTLSQGVDTLEIALQTTPSEPSEEAFLQAWKKTRNKELAIGHTLIGPHRDDLTLTLSGRPARHHASEGQMRSLALALRLAEWRRLSAHSDAPPLKLVDDFGMQLDEYRRQALLELLDGPGQTFVTSPQQLNWPGLARLYCVKNGTLV